MLNFDILLRDVKKKYTYVDKDSGAAVTLKLPSISFFSAPVRYMSGNDPAPVHTEVRRRMMSRLRGSS